MSEISPYEHMSNTDQLEPNQIKPKSIELWLFSAWHHHKCVMFWAILFLSQIVCAINKLQNDERIKKKRNVVGKKKKERKKRTKCGTRRNDFEEKKKGKNKVEKSNGRTLNWLKIHWIRTIRVAHTVHTIYGDDLLHHMNTAKYAGKKNKLRLMVIIK